MKKLIPAAAVLALIIPSIALAAGSFTLSPSSVKPGGVLTVSGSVLNGCKKGSTVTAKSTGFKGGKHVQSEDGEVHVWKGVLCG